MTSEQEIARTKRLVFAARALLSLQVGLVVGAIRINKVLIHLPPEMGGAHNIFGEFLSSIPLDIPLENARLHRSHAALIEMDKKLAPLKLATEKDCSSYALKLSTPMAKSLISSWLA